ncbi:MAG: hypothetical protein WHV28_09605 [Bacteroidota bacterium]
MSEQPDKIKATCLANGLIQFYGKDKQNEKEIWGSITCRTADNCDYRIMIIHSCGFGAINYDGRIVFYVWNDDGSYQYTIEERK